MARFDAQQVEAEVTDPVEDAEEVCLVLDDAEQNCVLTARDHLHPQKRVSEPVRQPSTYADLIRTPFDGAHPKSVCGSAQAPSSPLGVLHPGETGALT